MILRTNVDIMQAQLRTLWKFVYAVIAVHCWYQCQYDYRYEKATQKIQDANDINKKTS